MIAASTRRGRALAAAALLAALAAGACGQSSPPEPAPGRSEERTELPPRPSVVEAERFARIDVPRSATDVEAVSGGAMDEVLRMRFTIPRADLATFVRGSRFTERLEEGYRPFLDGEVAETGWKTERIERLRGVSEIVDGLGRRVLVDLDDPERATVYVVAGSL